MPPSKKPTEKIPHRYVFAPPELGQEDPYESSRRETAIDELEALAHVIEALPSLSEMMVFSGSRTNAVSDTRRLYQQAIQRAQAVVACLSVAEVEEETATAKVEGSFKIVVGGEDDDDDDEEDERDEEDKEKEDEESKPTVPSELSRALKIEASSLSGIIGHLKKPESAVVIPSTDIH